MAAILGERHKESVRLCQQQKPYPNMGMGMLGKCPLHKMLSHK